MTKAADFRSWHCEAIEQGTYTARRMRTIALQSAVGGMVLSIAGMLLAASGHQIQCPSYALVLWLEAFFGGHVVLIQVRSRSRNSGERRARWCKKPRSDLR